MASVGELELLKKWVEENSFVNTLIDDERPLSEKMSLELVLQCKSRFKLLHASIDGQTREEESLSKLSQTDSTMPFCVVLDRQSA